MADKTLTCMRACMQTLLHSFLNLFYPQSCLHCQSNTVESSHPLCSSCLQQLTLLKAEGRCYRCFMAYEGKGLCLSCRQQPYLRRAAAAFSYEGAAVSLVKGLKYGSLDYLASGMGAFMAAQLLTLEWPLPDYLVPVPMAATHLISRGYNQSRLLADSLALVLGRPVCEALGRYSGDYSQAGLLKHQREALTTKRFVLRKKEGLQGKRLLIVDDVMTTGQTMTCCAQLLADAYPSAIYAIAFCRTDH